MNKEKIIEELINDYRNCGLDDFPDSVIDFGLNKSQIIALKNLVQEYKKLKEENKELKRKLQEHITIEAHEQVKQLYIPKSKVKDLRKIDNIDLLQFKIKELLEE